LRALAATAVAVAAALWAAVPASELLLPGHLERRVENRLTARGGSATVSLEAVPALRLLARRGDEVGIEAEQLELELPPQGARIWTRLDGFRRVRIRLQDSRAGPFDLRVLRLEKANGGGLYRLTVDAVVSARSFAGYAGGIVGEGLSDLAGAVGVPVARTLPVDADLRVASDDGRPRVVSGGATVAGFPADLVVHAVAGSITSPL